MSQMKVAVVLDDGVGQYTTAANTPANKRREVFVPLNDDGSAVRMVDGGIAPGSLNQFEAAEDIVVSTAGTAVQGIDFAAIRGVWIVASQNNVGAVYVGGSSVTDSSGNSRGAVLTPAGMSSFLAPVTNLNQIYVNADNDGDRVGVVVI